MDSHHRKPYRLRLKNPAPLDEALPGHSEAYRRLDAAALEALILKGPLAMTDDDIAAKRGISYCSDFDETLRAGSRRRGRRRLLPPPHPGPAGPRRRRRRRDDAAEVDLLLPQAPHRDRLQPAAAEGRARAVGWSAQWKIYTRKGDDGTTGALVRRAAAKSDVRIEAYGTLDEAGSALGVARSLCDDGPTDASSPPTSSRCSATCSSPAPSSRPPRGGRAARGRRQPGYRRR